MIEEIRYVELAMESFSHGYNYEKGEWGDSIEEYSISGIMLISDINERIFYETRKLDLEGNELSLKLLMGYNIKGLTDEEANEIIALFDEDNFDKKYDEYSELDEQFDDENDFIIAFTELQEKGGSEVHIHWSEEYEWEKAGQEYAEERAVDLGFISKEALEYDWLNINWRKFLTEYYILRIKGEKVLIIECY